MRRLIVLAACMIADPVLANNIDSFAPVACPYARSDVPTGYDARCSSMAWRDQGINFRTTVAVFTPESGNADAVPVIYIPGGPGDAPVNKGGDVSTILSLFPDRTIATLNPRGVEGASPRPACTFDPDFWHQEVEPDRETEVVSQCRNAVTVDLSVFDAPYLAQDVSRLVRALGFERAGVFGISYGTESALHLISNRTPWLEFAVLDSLSLPGAVGTRERLLARDRFLGVVDRHCFSEEQCSDTVTERFDNLLEWAAQFDTDPVEINLGPDAEQWAMDGMEMLDFLASMAAYPDGAGYGPVFIDALDWSRDATGPWIESEMEVGFKYARDNFALLYGAFSDSIERYVPPPTLGEMRYPFDIDEQRSAARLFRVWNRENRNEERFVGPETERRSTGVPVLVVSGGVDSLTPIEWADELERRFSGMTRFVFPELGHAVAFGDDADVTDDDIISQLNCGPAVVRAFVNGEEYGSCAQYMKKATDD